MAFIKLQQKTQGGTVSGCYPPKCLRWPFLQVSACIWSKYQISGQQVCQSSLPFLQPCKQAAVFRELFWFSHFQRVQRFLPPLTPYSTSEIDKNTDSGVDVTKIKNRSWLEYKVLLVGILV